jgi:DNA repair protein RadC
MLGTPQKDIRNVAEILLRTFGSVRGVFNADIDELLQIDGFGEPIAIALRLARELNALYLQEKLELTPIQQHHDKIMELWRSRMAALRVEVVEIAYLDSNLCLVRRGIERMESGTASTTAIHPRKIAESAIRRQSTAIMLAHNHPSGSATPSHCDRHNTAKLRTALKCLDIDLLDHVIFSRNDIFSFKEHGLLQD